MPMTSNFSTNLGRMPVGFRRPRIFPLGGRRQVNHRFRQRQVALRHADEMHSLLGSHGYYQRLRVGHSDVFRSEAD